MKTHEIALDRFTVQALGDDERVQAFMREKAPKCPKCRKVMELTRVAKLREMFSFNMMQSAIRKAVKPLIGQPITASTKAAIGTQVLPHIMPATVKPTPAIAKAIRKLEGAKFGWAYHCCRNISPVKKAQFLYAIKRLEEAS